MPFDIMLVKAPVPWNWVWGVGIGVLGLVNVCHLITHLYKVQNWILNSFEPSF